MRPEGRSGVWGGREVAVVMGECDFPGVVQRGGKEDSGGSMGVADSQREWRKDSAGQSPGGTAVEMEYQRPRTRCCQDSLRSNQCSHRLWLLKEPIRFQLFLVVLEIGRQTGPHWVQWSFWGHRWDISEGRFHRVMKERN